MTDLDYDFFKRDRADLHRTDLDDLDILGNWLRHFRGNSRGINPPYGHIIIVNRSNTTELEQPFHLHG